MGFEGLGKIRKKSLFSKREKRSRPKDLLNAQLLVCDIRVSQSVLKTWLFMSSPQSDYRQKSKRGRKEEQEDMKRDRKRQMKKRGWEAGKEKEVRCQVSGQGNRMHWPPPWGQSETKFSSAS